MGRFVESDSIDYSLDGIGDYARKHLGAVKKANKGQFQKGQYAGKLYKIGDEVTIKVIGADKLTRKIDFSLVINNIKDI